MELEQLLVFMLIDGYRVLSCQRENLKSTNVFNWIRNANTVALLDDARTRKRENRKL